MGEAIHILLAKLSWNILIFKMHDMTVDDEKTCSQAYGFKNTPLLPRRDLGGENSFAFLNSPPWAINMFQSQKMRCIKSELGF
jgi:hypothetical protein